MSFSRFHIVAIMITFLGICRFMLMLLEKQIAAAALGWFAVPVISFFSTVLDAWFIIVATALTLVFYDYSSTPLMTVVLIVIFALILKSAEIGLNLIP